MGFAGLLVAFGACAVIKILTWRGLTLVYGPYHQAIADGDVREVRRFLDSGTPVDLPDENGDTGLCIALVAKRWDVARLLIERGARVNIDVPIGEDGSEPLTYYLALTGNKEAYHWLLRHGAKPSADAERFLRTGYVPR